MSELFDQDEGSFDQFDYGLGRGIVDAADVSWGSPRRLTMESIFIYADRELTWWERFKVRFLHRRDPRALGFFKV